MSRDGGTVKLRFEIIDEEYLIEETSESLLI